MQHRPGRAQAAIDGASPLPCRLTFFAPQPFKHLRQPRPSRLGQYRLKSVTAGAFGNDLLGLTERLLLQSIGATLCAGCPLHRLGELADERASLLAGFLKLDQQVAGPAVVLDLSRTILDSSCQHLGRDQDTNRTVVSTPSLELSS